MRLGQRLDDSSVVLRLGLGQFGNAADPVAPEEKEPPGSAEIVFEQIGGEINEEDAQTTLYLARMVQGRLGLIFLGDLFESLGCWIRGVECRPSQAAGTSPQSTQPDRRWTRIGRSSEVSAS